MKKIKVAFIVPVWNVNKYLFECLDSISKVTLEKEVIVVDDRGQEDPWLIFDLFKNNKSFIFIKNDKNIGQGFSRNVAINHVSSDVTHIMFVDSDDSLLWENINILKLNAGETYYPTKYFSHYKSSLKSSKLPFFFGKKYSFFVWGIFWSIDAIGNVRFSSKHYEDMLFMVKIFSKQKINCNFTDTIIYKYRQRLSSITKSRNDLSIYIEYAEQIAQAVKIIDASRRNVNKVIGRRWEKFFTSLTYKEAIAVQNIMPEYPKIKIILRFLAIRMQKFLRINKKLGSIRNEKECFE